MYDYDLFVIGAGSGGVRAARMAAARGVRVAVAEDRALGGTCVNEGCIPKKLFVYGAHFREAFADAAAYGWGGSRAEETRADRPRTVDWPTLRGNKDREIGRLNGVYERLLVQAGVTIVPGRAVLAGPQAVQVGERRFTAERILIATGSWPVVPDVPGASLAVTSNEVFRWPSLPRRILVVGGGYIAVEFAGIFAGLGCETRQFYRGPLFLRGFDRDVRSHLAGAMQDRGIDLRFNCQVTAIERQGQDLVALLQDGSRVGADAILYATGRAPKVAGLGLAEAGVRQAGNGAIQVNDRFQTSVPSIYALGDVIDRVQLTPVALAQAMALVRDLYDGDPSGMDGRHIPTAVFSQPPIGTVGLTEEAARAGGRTIDIYRSRFRPLKLTMTDRTETTMMKMIVDRDSDRVIGLHMVGDDAGEIMQGFAVAMQAGATKADFDRTIGIHPTAAEEFVTMREPVPQEAA